MTKDNFVRILRKTISKIKELNTYQGKSYSWSAGGSEAIWVGVVQPADMEIAIKANYHERVRIIIKSNGDIFLHESILSDLGVRVVNPENEDQIVEQAIKLLDEILAKKE